MRVSAPFLVRVDSPANALRLRLRRGLGRRSRAPRRKGSRPRRDDAARRPRARRVHDHDRGVPRVPRGGWRGPSGSRRRGRRAPRGPGEADGEGLRRRRKPAPRFRALGCGDLDAGDDGHDPQSRPLRCRRRRARGFDGQRAFRARLVPTARPDVRRGRRRSRRAALRARPERPEGRAGVSRRTSISPPTTCASSSPRS